MMRKYLIALGLVLFCATSLIAQKNITWDFYSKTNKTKTDTVTSGLKVIVSPAIAEYFDMVGVETTITKISGTVAGVVRLYGSYDGTNWVRINATDSLNATNVASQYKSFTVTSYPYRYLGVGYTASGTMSAKMTAKALYKRRP